MVVKLFAYAYVISASDVMVDMLVSNARCCCFSDRYAALTREGDGEKAKARLDRGSDDMSVTFYFSDKSPRVQSHASSK